MCYCAQCTCTLFNVLCSCAFTDTDGLIQAGERRRRSQRRRRRSQSRSRRSSRCSWEPPPPLVEPNIQSCHASDDQQALVDAQCKVVVIAFHSPFFCPFLPSLLMSQCFSIPCLPYYIPSMYNLYNQNLYYFFFLVARDVRSLPPVWLLTLLRDKQWRKFSEVVRLLDKTSGQNTPLLSKMTEEALHAYVRSQEFQDNPQLLISLLQGAGCQIQIPPTSSGSIKNRHSIPPNCYD